jgi:hypothetical protein
MGGTMVVPETDPRMDRVIELFMLTDVDLAKFYKYFDKLGEPFR